jgi:hypothetical protein
MIIGGVAGAVVIALVVLLVTGAFSSDSNKKSGSTTAAKGTTGGSTRILYEGVLKKQGNEKGDGVALVIQSGGTAPQLVVQAEALTPTGQKNAYEVWLYNSPTDVAPLGAQFTDKNGGLQGRGPLPSNFRNFKSVVVSREQVGTNPSKPSNIVLRGDLVAVPANAQQGTTGATGATGP